MSAGSPRTLAPCAAVNWLQLASILTPGGKAAYSLFTAAVRLLRESLGFGSSRVAWFA